MRIDFTSHTQCYTQKFIKIRFFNINFLAKYQIWIFFWSIVHSSHGVTTWAESKRKRSVKRKLANSTDLQMKCKIREDCCFKSEKVKVKTAAAGSDHGRSDPWPGQGHRLEVNWRYMFRSEVLPACSRDAHFSVLASHRYSQNDPYRNRPLGLLTCARQTLTERNRSTWYTRCRH